MTAKIMIGLNSMHSLFLTRQDLVIRQRTSNVNGVAEIPEDPVRKALVLSMPALRYVSHTPFSCGCKRIRPDYAVSVV